MTNVTDGDSTTYAHTLTKQSHVCVVKIAINTAVVNTVHGVALTFKKADSFCVGQN